MEDFSGVKIALIKGNELLVILRDNKPGLRFADMWDLPGGGREGNETPFECVSRELNEELGLTIKSNSIIWTKIYPAMHNPAEIAYFMVASIKDEDVDNIIFGDEGQRWELMDIKDFLKNKKTISFLKKRLKDYILTN